MVNCSWHSLLRRSSGHPAIFFPGDIPSQKEDIHQTPPETPARQPTVWRQTRMILDAVKHCLYTSVNKLRTCIQNWAEIGRKLAEPPRKRLSQTVHIHQLLLKPG